MTEKRPSSPDEPTVVGPPPGVESSRSLKDMLSQAREKSKGQGVVQGSTIFFKNIAESIGHANRNLKIGLAFLTAAFLVVAASLGWLIVRAFQTQTATKTSLEKQIQAMDSATRRQIQPLLDSLTGIEKKLTEQQEAQRREVDGVRALLQSDLDAAKQDAAAARKEAQELRGALKSVEKWAAEFGTTYVQDRSTLDARLKRLEAAPAPAPATPVPAAPRPATK